MTPDEPEQLESTWTLSRKVVIWFAIYAAIPVVAGVLSSGALFVAVPLFPAGLGCLLSGGRLSVGAALATGVAVYVVHFVCVLRATQDSLVKGLYFLLVLLVVSNAGGCVLFAEKCFRT